MNDHALKSSDYVEWDGPSLFVPAPMEIRESDTVDKSEIRLLTERAMRYWTSELGVTVYALREAIAATGSREPAVVRAYLESHATD